MQNSQCVFPTTGEYNFCLPGFNWRKSNDTKICHLKCLQLVYHNRMNKTREDITYCGYCSAMLSQLLRNIYSIDIYQNIVYTIISQISVSFGDTGGNIYINTGLLIVLLFQCTVTKTIGWQLNLDNSRLAEWFYHWLAVCLDSWLLVRKPIGLTMMTSWHGSVFRTAGPLWEETTADQCIPFTKGKWCWRFFWC